MRTEQNNTGGGRGRSRGIRSSSRQSVVEVEAQKKKDQKKKKEAKKPRVKSNRAISKQTRYPVGTAAEAKAEAKRRRVCKSD